MAKKMKLPLSKLIMGALVLGGGYYAYSNRDDLRVKVASLIGKKAIATSSAAAPAAAKAIAAPAMPKTVVAPSAATGTDALYLASISEKDKGKAGKLYAQWVAATPDKATRTATIAKYGTATK